ncbi:hypothetical protein G5S37_28405 [Roseimicrobium sp. ORNL1]|nr:hypothetical protein G5S37_28405 [Roseimicrobium sp. ORNL1]
MTLTPFCLIVSFLQRCWRARWIRILAWIGVGILMVYVGLTVWMNRAGKRDWKAAQEALAREGVDLDFRSAKGIVEIPDELNFCAIPLLKGLAIIEDGNPAKGESAAKRKALEALGPLKSHTGSYPPISSKDTDMPVNLREWADWLRKEGHPMPVTDPDNAAREVLGAMSYQDAAIAEMVAALFRPHSRLTPDWRLGPFPELLLQLQVPHLGALQSFSNGLSLRAKAAAQAGEYARAHEATLCLARIAEATCQEPHLIGLLVGVTSASILSQTTWELGTAHCGTADDFLRLQQALEKFDLRQDAVRAFKQEIVAGVDSLLYLKRNRQLPSSSLDEPSWDSMQKLVWLVPEGWFDSNAAHVATLNLEYIVKPLRDRGWASSLVEGERLEARLKAAKAEIWRHTDMIVAVLAMPAFTRFVDRAAYAQSFLDRAIVACALERFRLERGAYPDALTELARAGEKPLPLDILSGKPMGYRKTTGGRYVLWAVGFDGKDDNGHRPSTGSYRDKPTNRQYEGDWVWSYPTAEEIAASRVPAAPVSTKRSKKQTVIKGAEDSTPKVEN